MKKFFIPYFFLLFCFYTYAIIPPKPGIKPSQSFIDFHKMIQQEYSEGYFAQKFRERKVLRDLGSSGLKMDKALDADTVFALTLLGQFSNLPANYTQQDFQNLLFDGTSPTGTVTDFYKEISYDQLHFTGTCSGWYNMPGTMEEYVGNNDGLGTQGGPRFVLDILDIADSTLNFANYIQYYDAQNRPHIGFIAVVHSGGDAAQGAENIWSHRWNFTVVTGGQPYTTNDIDPVSGQNVVIDGDYSIQPERSGSSNTSGPLITIGVFAHEFGHIFGLPDLYDTDYTSEGLGNWCLMAGGAYGGNGGTSDTPVHMSAWCKKELGWVTPINITESLSSFSVPNVEENPVVYRMWKNSTEGFQYFLIENRQRIGNDTYIYNPGLLIYHVDESRSGNTDDDRYLVDLEQADGLRQLNSGQGRGDGGDPFPGSTGNINFDYETNPNSKDYSLQNTFVSIRNIHSDGTNMIADFDIGSFPFLELNNVNVTEAVFDNGRVEAGESGNINFTLQNISPANSANTTISFSIDEEGIEINSSDLSSSITGETIRVLTIDQAISVAENFIPRMIKINYQIVSEGNSISDSIEVPIGIPGILIVSKAEDEILSDYYKSALLDLNNYYEHSFNQFPEFISSRKAVIVFSGRTSADIFTPTEIDSLTNYISGGGNIFFSGQVLAENLETSYPEFLHNILNISWSSNQFVPQHAYGQNGDLFGDKLSDLRLGGNEGAGNEIRPDIISAINPLLFHYSLSYTADGTKPGGGWMLSPQNSKIFFLGFGFESINNNESSITRAEMLDEILTWFNGTTDVPFENGLAISDYSLSQNYPNPFNPATVISYQIPLKGFVSLKVYDILGKEVRTLVNEEKDAGKYEIHFDASSLASGVYLYKINSDSYSEIKKMILIK